MAPGGRITRVHGPFVADDEVERITTFLKSQGDPDYEASVTEESDSGLFPGDEGEALEIFCMIKPCSLF